MADTIILVRAQDQSLADDRITSAVETLPHSASLDRSGDVTHAADRLDAVHTAFATTHAHYQDAVSSIVETVADEQDPSALLEDGAFVTHVESVADRRLRSARLFDAEGRAIRTYDRFESVAAAIESPTDHPLPYWCLEYVQE